MGCAREGYPIIYPLCPGLAERVPELLDLRENRESVCSLKDG